MNTFVASYESMERAEKEARAAGWDGVSEGMLDYIDAHYANIRREFKTKVEALTWLTKELDEGKSLFGCGDIDEIEHVALRQRCQYCICQGRREVASWIASHEGIEDEREVRDECYSDNV